MTTATPAPTPSSLNSAIGQAVRALRVAAGWSQFRLAAAVGLSQAQVSGLERGARSWTPRRMSSVCDAFGVAPHTLMPASPGVTVAESLLLDAHRCFGLPGVLRWVAGRI